jgi:hypothetical protein
LLARCSGHLKWQRPRGIWLAAPDATGTLLGCWRTEFSTLGRLLILREFDTADALHRERRRALLNANPFNAGRLTTAKASKADHGRRI